MRIAGRGQISVWEGGSLWLLQAESARASTDLHAHHAIQVTLSIDGSMELRTASDRLRGPAVVVAADIAHDFTATGRVAFLFIEPESAAGLSMTDRFFRGRALASLETDDMRDLIARLRARPDSPALRDGELAEIGKALIESISCTCAPRSLDPRVQAMIEYAQANLDKPITLAQATSRIGLSPSRLRHLFVEETGLAFKTYVLWLRMQRAVERYAAGATLTAAAHEAAFSDSAHFSRTFRRTFGVAAASLRLAQSANRPNEQG
jgi:AraC-like DNA-binding protein